jgi:hypothetical protein
MYAAPEFGNVVVYYAVDTAEIHTPGKNVGGDEDPNLAVAEAGHDLGARRV